MKKMTSILFVLLLLVSGSAFAQVPPGFCGGLAEADCAILTASSEAMTGLNSGTATMNIDLTVSNIPDAPFESLAFNVAGDMVYHVDPALVEKYAAMQADPSALLKDMSQLGPMMEELFSGMDGQVSLKLTIPQDIVDLAAESGSALPTELSTELRLVAGVGYINLSSLAEALPEAGVPTGWYGLEIAKLMGSAMNMALAQMEGQAMPSFDPSMFSQFTDPAFLESYIKVERLADSDGAAVFQMSFDMAALATSPAFRDMMVKQMEMMGQEVDEAQIDQMIAMVAQMYEGLDMSITQSVDLSTSYMTHMDMVFDWDLTALMSASGASSDVAAPVINLVMSADYADFNAAPEVTAPEDATVFTAEQIMQMMAGSMAGVADGLDVTPEATPGS
ncbi:MAG TPA: hypothetical protein VHO69_19240 [Phototrophicaceae bacterium]|nr:hypothetical protein [Phototrophicaceae bacterium]